MTRIERHLSETGSQLIQVRVVAMRHAAQDIHLLELEPAAGGYLPAAEPGAHVELHLPCGLVRHYSLIEPDPRPRRYLIGVKRDKAGRGGSIYIHDSLRLGTVLGIGAPRNNFALVRDDSPAVLIGGGIGITPLISMMRQLSREGRPWSLFYAARTRGEAAFLEELDGHGNVTLHFDDENPGSFLDMERIIRSAPQGAHFYCCGPQPMLASFRQAAQAAVDPRRIHVEYFAPEQESARDGGFVVELARSGRQFTIPPGRTILEVLLEAGLNVAYSCTEGICGACEVKVISGMPDHRDSVLDDRQRAENRRMMICCSGARTDRLVIDI